MPIKPSPFKFHRALKKPDPRQDQFVCGGIVFGSDETTGVQSSWESLFDGVEIPHPVIDYDNLPGDF